MKPKTKIEARMCELAQQLPPLPQPVGEQRDHDGLQAMGDQGDKHRRGVEEEVPQEGTDAAHDEGSCRIQQHGGCVDHHIAEIQMPAGDGNRENAQRQDHIHRGQEAGQGQPERAAPAKAHRGCVQGKHLRIRSREQRRCPAPCAAVMDGYLTASKAASSAAIRSFTFSVPMERRIVLGRMP